MRVVPIALVLASLAAAPAALADRLVLADGRVVEGTVTKEGEDYRVLSRFGESVVPGKDVTEWVRAKPFDEEWRERLAAIPEKDLDRRVALARWLVDAGRKAEAEATAALVLDADPEHAGAHELLGHVRFRGAWTTPDEAKRQQGLIRRGDTWYTPAEWALLDESGKKKAEEAESQAVARRRVEAVNEAMRLMLAKDKDLRREGERRMREIAKESGSGEIEALVPQVKAYAEKNDEMAAIAAAGGAGAGRILSETRIQLATLKRPIKQIQTALASGPTGFPFSTNSQVTIQLPELEVITIRSTVSLPAGG